MNKSTKFIYENKLGKVVFEYDSSFWIESIDGISSVEIEMHESQYYGQIGSSITGQQIKPRSPVINGFLTEPVKENREQLIRVISPNVLSKLTKVEGSESWYIDVLPKLTPYIDPGEHYQNFQVELYAAYPLWRSTESYSNTVSGIQPMFKFPFSTTGEWWISKITDPFVTLTNSGNAPLDISIIIYANSRVVNPELFQVDTRRSIKLLKTMEAGEKFIISTVEGKKGVKHITQDGVESNGFRYLTIESDLRMQLEIGENYFRGDASENKEGMSITIESPKGVRSGV